MELLDLPGDQLLRIVELLTSLERIRLLGACRRLDALALLRERDGQLLTLDCPSMGARALPASGLAFLLRRAGPGLHGADLVAPCCSQLGVEALLAAVEQPCAGQLRSLVALRPSPEGGWMVGPFFSPQDAVRLGAALPHLGRSSLLGLVSGAGQLPSALAALRDCTVHVRLSHEDEQPADGDVAAALAAAAAGAPDALAGLKVECQVGPLLMAEIAAAVRAGLRTLELVGYRIGDDGAQALAEALREKAKLSTLVLNRSSIGEAGAQVLAGALRENATLTTMNLGANSIGDAGAQALAGALRVNTTLTKLDLGGDGIGDSGAEALAGALRENSTLTELILNFNRIGEAGAQALARAMRENAALTTLELLWNDPYRDIRDMTTNGAAWAQFFYFSHYN